MARISTYSLDTNINDNDQLIGTDGGTGIAGSSGGTKNFSIGALREFINSREDGITGDYDTQVNISDVLDGLQLSTAHAFYAPGTSLIAILPSSPADGSWVRIAAIGNTGLMIFAGDTDRTTAAAANPGNRFMAGIDSNGVAAVDDHSLIVPAQTNTTFELIYIEDEITTAAGTAPVGWIIVN